MIRPWPLLAPKRAGKQIDNAVTVAALALALAVFGGHLKRSGS